MRHQGFHGRTGCGVRPALIVVDLNVGFTDPESPLVCPLDEVVTAIQALLRETRSAGFPIVYTTVAYDAAALRAAAAFIEKVPALLTLEVGSRWVRSDYDSANWITRETAYNTTAALNHDFDVLGRHIVSCHAKDSWIENRLTLHIEAGCPGKGTMDFQTLFRRMEDLSPEYPAIVEGAGTDDLPAVSALFHNTARELGIQVLD